MTHTPGPWGVHEGTENLFVESENDRMTVTSVPLFPDSAALGLCSQTRLENHQRNRVSRANAELIAAAPELLGALKAIAAQLECPSRNTTMTSYRRDGSVIISHDVRARVRAAIAKATGE